MMGASLPGLADLPWSACHGGEPAAELSARDL
jgi:hypothetical protein